MTKEHFPATPAIRAMKEKGVTFTLHPYKYEERGGTETAARELGVDEYRVVKTIVMEDDDRKSPFIVIMHGNRHVSTKNMARLLGVKSVSACDPKVAEKHTGYMVGGTSPFGTRKLLPVYVEATVLDLPKILINAGRKGLLAEMAPSELLRVLDARPVTVAVR
ncbi:MAG: Cys-tRNA(Pro) deacylase [Syntrophobacterales bacterium]|nr:Cys-tRNA(Pro) deacylase [Syntrophobacterales bacterium]